MSSLWDRVVTRLGSEAMQALSQKVVGIIALGSLGSQIAEMLAMSSIEHFVLIDPDTLDEHNVIRHAAGIPLIGMHKVQAVRHVIVSERNPKAEIITFTVDARKIIDQLKSCDIVIVAGLGSEIVTSQVAELLREHNIPALFAGLYDQAIAGDVFLVDTQDNNAPCYACFASLISDIKPTLVKREINYGAPLDELKAVPGLGVHVMRVATTAADWILRILINDNSVMKKIVNNNFVIAANGFFKWGSGDQDVLLPGQAEWFSIQKNPDCLICGLDDDSNPDVEIDNLID